MTTLHQTEPCCPICRHSFQSLGVAVEERAILTYLVGELWRRTGDMRQARKWFDRVPEEITDGESQRRCRSATD